MAVPSSTCHVDRISAPSSPVTITSNEKMDIKHSEIPDVSLDAKTDVKVGLNEVGLSEVSTNLPRVQTYIRSFGELFTLKTVLRCGAVLVKFGKFTGPGTIISVAYVDPDRQLPNGRIFWSRISF